MRHRSRSSTPSSLIQRSLLYILIAALGCLSILSKKFIQLKRSTTTISSRFLNGVDVGIDYDEDNDEQAPDEEEEESEDFLNVTVVVCIVLLLLALTIAFEHTKEHLEEMCAKEGRHMASILEKLFGEMTVLGFLSLATFLITQTGVFEVLSDSLYHKQGELLEMFELVHFSIFFVMIFFVLQVFVLVRGAIETEHEWVHMDRVARHRRQHGSLPESVSIKEEDDQESFEALRNEFLLEREVEPPFRPTPPSHRVPEDFAFGRYLSMCLGNLLTHAVEVNMWTWLFFAGATIVYYVLCLLVEENERTLVWTWIAIGWLLFLFNMAFERHLLELRSTFATTAETTQINGEGSQLLEPSASLPSWCHVDLDAYMRSRSWWTRIMVGGKPNRQQSGFWMERKGPKLYLIVLQINLIFMGLYCALHLLQFAKVMLQEPVYIFVIYLVLATLPVLGIMLNKQRLVATLSQVCCLGIYRRPQVVTAVQREEKTARVVRSFIILYKLRQLAEQTGSHNNKPGGHHSTTKQQRSKRSFDKMELADISKTFEAYDHSGDGFITYDEFRQLMSNLGTPLDEEGLRRMIAVLDEDKSGCVSKAEFLQWYAEHVSRHDGDYEEDETSDRDRAVALFGMFDQNNTGQITIGEFKLRLDAMHAGLTVDDVGAIINELDEDNNGSIGLEEFEMLIEKYYPRELGE